MRANPSNHGLGSSAFKIWFQSSIQQLVDARALARHRISTSPAWITNETRNRKLADPLVNECYRSRQLSWRGSCWVGSHVEVVLVFVGDPKSALPIKIASGDLSLQPRASWPLIDERRASKVYPKLSSRHAASLHRGQRIEKAEVDRPVFDLLLNPTHILGIR